MTHHQSNSAAPTESSSDRPYLKSSVWPEGQDVTPAATEVSRRDDEKPARSPAALALIVACYAAPLAVVTLLYAISFSAVGGYFLIAIVCLAVAGVANVALSEDEPHRQRLTRFGLIVGGMTLVRVFFSFQ